MAKSPYSRRRGGYGKRRGPSLLKKLLLWLALILIPIIALGSGGYLAAQYLGREQIDTAYCYTRPDQHQAAIFVDFSLTHQISPSQRRDLVNTFVQSFEGMPPNGKLSVFTTAQEGTSSVNVPVFALCKPAKTPQEQERLGAPASSAPKLVRQHGEAMATFRAFLGDLIAKSQDSAHIAASSPILEQIQGISRYRFASPLSKLTLFTDGLNNSAVGQFCVKQGHLPRFETFASRPEYRFIKPDDFNGADIYILLVEQRSLPNDVLPFCTTAELRGWWVSFFEGNGAGNVRLTPLGYGAGQ
ncbi:hypothetical protein [Thalassococcus sp. S3]|uniref:hypothetical protein n=1 Tax=Thalassococcus sp. S3 TaxID=2017482 RepID=UPI001023F972|nr:hypothetical protein [Thalassococcus sp. S3]QBF32344.1 hypothetical protein CFI11_14135 [Thalassococcus sp. S3]